MASRSGGQGTNSIEPEPAASMIICARSRRGKVLVVTDVEDLPGSIRRLCGAQQALDDVVDVQAVALLSAFAEDLDGLVEQRPPHEDRQEALKVVPKPLSGSVDVGEPNDRGR